MGIGCVVSIPVTSTAETLYETPSGSGLGETPGKALLTVAPFRQWFIFCSSFLQYDDTDFIPGFFASNPPLGGYDIPVANPVPTNVGRYNCPFWTFAFGQLPPLNPTAPLQDPYTCYFEITLGQPDMSNSEALSLSPNFGYWAVADLPSPGYAPSAGWRYTTLDALFDTSWLLQNNLGLGYLCTGAVTNPAFRTDMKPLFEPHGFAVFPSPNFKTAGYAPFYSSGFTNLVFTFPEGGIDDWPPFGTTICLNKAGTKGCIALHDYDASHNLMPCDPSTIQVVDLAVDGPVFYNGPSSTAATGQALVFWIGLTPEEVPQAPDMTPFTPASKGLLTVQ